MNPNKFKLLLNHGFSPLSLFSAGQTGAWYDPSNIGSMFQDIAGTIPAVVGQPVGKMLDLSGNGHHLVQATANKCPTLQLASGLYYLQFDGSNDDLATAAAVDFSASSSIGVALAFTPTSTSDGLLMEFGPNTNSIAKTFNFVGINDSAAGHVSAGVNGSAIGALQTTSSSLGNGVTSLASAQGLDVTKAGTPTSAIPLRLNGAPVAVTALANGTNGTTYSTQTLYIGARAGTSVFASVKIYGLLVRGTPFTLAQLAPLETWMGGKAGLTI